LKVRECVRPNIAIDAQTEPRTDKVWSQRKKSMLWSICEIKFGIFCTT
jgi:hypothetical protein